MSFDDQLAARQDEAEKLIDTLGSGAFSEDDAADAVEAQKEQIECLKEQILGRTGDMKTKEITPSC